ncbi:MAG: choline kinase [Alphaproteobacteria bacterium]|nr:MAG: choline kinase [Alphaproteobacteria bacterium]
MNAMDRLRALPCWQGEIAAEPLHGGLSNESWKVTDAAGTHVVRFGTDYPFHHVIRERELMTARAAHAAGFAPAVEYAEPGVTVSAFIEARTWGEADVRAAPERVADLIRGFHSRMAEHVTGPGFIFWVFHVIRDYARTLEAGNSGFRDRIPGFLALARGLEAVQVPMPIVFGHHDLLPANFLDDGERLWLIDFEYAGFGTAMFDLAGAASNAGMSDEEAGRLLSAYFGHAPDAATLRAFDAMQCASLLREAMWAMVSELHLSAPGADYTDYARENLERLEAALASYRAKHGDSPT